MAPTGQTLTQTPQPVHFSGITMMKFSVTSIALTGQTVAQAWQTPHSSPSTSASFFVPFFLVEVVGDMVLHSYFIEKHGH
jgi:hypothetical protein